MRILQSTLHCIFVVVVTVKCAESLDFVYRNYTEMKAALQDFSSIKHLAIKTNIYTIGKSGEGKELLVFNITAAQNPLLVPNVKLIGGIFGDQPVGTEILLHFIDHLITSYGKNANVTYLLNNTRLHFLPCLNPDGSAIGTEGNLMQISLHKSFPDFYIRDKSLIQPESKAIMKWMEEIYFILSASLNSGGKVVIYPYSTKENFVRSNRDPSITPDDEVFTYLAKRYSKNRLTTLARDTECYKDNSNFTDGIANGATLKPQDGVMQDYNYFKHGCMELDVRVSCTKKPSEEALEGFLMENKEALVQYLLKGNQGVHGVVKDSATGKPIKASFKITGRDIEFTTNEMGEFWKVLLNGSYEIQVTAKGYNNKTEKFEVKYFDVLPKLEQLNILLTNSSISTTTTTHIESANVTQDYESTQVPVVGSVLSYALVPAISPYLLLLSFIRVLVMI